MRDDRNAGEPVPKVDVLLFASAAACIGVALAQIWEGLWTSLIAAALLFVLVGGALLVRSSRPVLEIPPSMLLAGGLGGAVLATVVLLLPYGDGDVGPLLRAAAALIPAALLFATAGWVQLRRSSRT